jgi:hypothetical protein
VNCNKEKDNTDVREWLKTSRKKRGVTQAHDNALLEKIAKLERAPMRAPTAMNIVNNALVKALGEIATSIRTTTGADTAHARRRLGVEKTHWTDAAAMTGCSNPVFACGRALRIDLMSRGHRRAVNSDPYGFPRRKENGERVDPKGPKRSHRVAYGDRVQSVHQRKGVRFLLGTVISLKADARAVVETKTGERFNVMAHQLTRRHHVFAGRTR